MRNFTFTMRQSGKRGSSTAASTRVAGPLIENLESRALFSATALSFVQLPTAGNQNGSILSYGNGGDDSRGTTGNAKPTPPPKIPSVDFGNIGNISVIVIGSTFSF